jgi:antitoxin CptB
MQDDPRLKRLRFRAWHRGTREADLLIGGFFDAHCETWNAEEMAWFETLLDEQDVDIIAWAIGAAEPPAAFDGDMMNRMRLVDYVKYPE